MLCDKDDNWPSCRHLTHSSTLTIVLCFAMGAGEAKPSDHDYVFSAKFWLRFTTMDLGLLKFSL